MLRHTKWSIGTLPGVLLAAAIAIGLAQPDQAWGQASVSVEADGTRHAGQFVVPVNKSQVLRLDVPFADLLVGNAEIADVLALTARSIRSEARRVGKAGFSTRRSRWSPYHSKKNKNTISYKQKTTHT